MFGGVQEAGLGDELQSFNLHCSDFKRGDWIPAFLVLLEINKKNIVPPPPTLRVVEGACGESTWPVPSDQHVAAFVTVAFMMAAQGRRSGGLHTCEILTMCLPSSKKALA